MPRDHQPDLRASPGRAADFFDSRPAMTPPALEVFRSSAAWREIIVAWFGDFPDMAWSDFLEHHPGARLHRSALRGLCKSGALVASKDEDRGCELYRAADHTSEGRVQSSADESEPKVAAEGLATETDKPGDGDAEQTGAEVAEGDSSAPEHEGWTSSRCQARREFLDGRLLNAIAEWEAIEEAERQIESLAARKSALSREISTVRARQRQLDDLCQLIELVEADDVVVEA